MTADRFALYRAGSEPYAAALNVFNSAVHAEPEAVVVPADETELAYAVQAAHAAGAAVSLRSGGHGIAARAIQGDWVIDMRRFDRLTFDGSRVTAGAGLAWSHVDEFCAAHGIAVPGGTVSSTGIAGLTLGGGIGWLLPQAGLTCDHLVAVKGVTGDGRAIRIDDTSDPALMRFLRGLGHGLLAITEFEYEPVPIPVKVSAGSLVYHLADSSEVMDTLIGAARDCPEYIGWSPALTWDGELPVLSVDGMSTGETTFDMWVQEICKVLPIRSNVCLRRYPEAQSMLDNPARWGQRSSWRSVFTTGLSFEAVAYLAESFTHAPSAGCQIFVERMAGKAKTAVTGRPSAFPLRWADFDVLIAAGWDSACADHAHRDWLATTKAGLCELLHQSPDSGTYANYADPAERLAALGPGPMEELAQVRSGIDPDGVFSYAFAAAPSTSGRRAYQGRPANQGKGH